MVVNTTNNTYEGVWLYLKSGEWILIKGGVDLWQLFYVSVAVSAAKPKAGFGPTILMKAMVANTTTNKNTVERFYLKSGD